MASPRAHFGHAALGLRLGERRESELPQRRRVRVAHPPPREGAQLGELRRGVALEDVATQLRHL